MELDVRDLQLLAALGDAGTMTAAAQQLFISQPALSQRLSKMEAKLDVVLFDRQGRRLVPNRAGQRMLVTAREVLRELHTAERDIREIRDGKDRRVRFAAQCNTTLQWLPPIIRRLRELFPGTEVRIETVPNDEPIAALLDDRIDVGLVTKSDTRMDSVAMTPLFSDELVAVVPATHPFAGRSYLTAADFNGVDLILYDSYDQSRVPVPALPIPHGSRPRRVSTVPLITDLLLEMVAGGEGITVLPNWVAAPHAESRALALVRIGRRPQARMWFAATRPGMQSAQVEFFTAELARQLPPK